jgi:acyl-coenzyme A thioesterase PaaI-like protein
MTADGDPTRTHLQIDRRLCGEPVVIEPGRAVIDWQATAETAADEYGLVHGGFVFGVADYAAMLAVNEPNVVLVAATSRFLRPVRAGERLRAEAIVGSSEGHRHRAEVTVRRGEEVVMEGAFDCAVTRRHVLGAAG